MGKNKTHIGFDGLALAALVGSALSMSPASAAAEAVSLGSGAEVRFAILSAQNGGAVQANDEKGPGEGKCGEGKCGEGKCGDDKKGDDKSGEGKCGEGKCG